MFNTYVIVLSVFYKGRDPRLRWTVLHPDHWTTNEVSYWLESVAEKHNLPAEELHSLSESFGGINGTELLSMTKEEFFQQDPKHGELLYAVLWKICESTSPPEETSSSGLFLPPIQEGNGNGNSSSPSAACPEPRRTSSDEDLKNSKGEKQTNSKKP